MAQRTEIEARIRTLREQARRVYQAAQRADSRQAYNDDLRAAARLENEADQLAASLQDHPDAA